MGNSHNRIRRRQMGARVFLNGNGSGNKLVVCGLVRQIHGKNRMINRCEDIDS
jgi:hypothetical protein